MTDGGYRVPVEVLAMRTTAESSLELPLTSLGALSPEWAQSLRAGNRSEQTIGIYLDALRQFDHYLATRCMPRTVDAIRREHCEAYFAGLRDRLAPATVSIRFRALQQFWKWALRTDEVAASPMDGLQRPLVPDEDVEVPRQADVQAMFRTIGGRTFCDVRDRALLLLLLDTGARRREITNLALDDIDWGYGDGEPDCFVWVTVKGGRRHRYAFGVTTRQALRRYVVRRGRHPRAADPLAKRYLWLGPKGRLTANGVYQIVRRRSRAAGLLKPLHPHSFRHLAAHTFMAAGGDWTDLGRLMGWTKGSAPRLAARYGSGLARERAEAAYRRIGAPSDRLGWQTRR